MPQNSYLGGWEDMIGRLFSVLRANLILSIGLAAGALAVMSVSLLVIVSLVWQVALMM